MHDRYRAVDAWVRRLLPATPPAILLGVGSPNDLSMLRSFARRGIPVLQLVSGRLIGSFSRFGVRVRMPPVEWEPEEWLGVLDRIASALGSPAVLFALMDEHCELVVRRAPRRALADPRNWLLAGDIAARRTLAPRAHRQLRRVARLLLQENPGVPVSRATDT